MTTKGLRSRQLECVPQLNEKIDQARRIIALTREDLLSADGRLHAFECVEMALRIGIVEELLSDVSIANQLHRQQRCYRPRTPKCKKTTDRYVRSRTFKFSFTSLVLAIVLHLGVFGYCCGAPEGLYAVDKISRIYRTSNANLQNHNTMADVLAVAPAQLDSVVPNDSSVIAPKVFLHLTPQWSCRLVQRQSWAVGDNHNDCSCEDRIKVLKVAA